MIPPQVTYRSPGWIYTHFVNRLETRISWSAPMLLPALILGQAMAWIYNHLIISPLNKAALCNGRRGVRWFLGSFWPWGYQIIRPSITSLGLSLNFTGHFQWCLEPALDIGPRIVFFSSFIYIPVEHKLLWGPKPSNLSLMLLHIATQHHFVFLQLGGSSQSKGLLNINPPLFSLELTRWGSFKVNRSRRATNHKFSISAWFSWPCLVWTIISWMQSKIGNFATCRVS